MLEYERKPQYNSITVTPERFVLISDDYSISLIRQNFNDKEDIDMPFEADMIRFEEWNSNRLKISCYRFLEWGNTIELFLDWNWNEETESYEITWSDN